MGALVFTDRSLMPPPAPRVPKRAGPTVLDEDEYVSRLDAIITREYFPDVPKLKDTLSWLQATNSGDPNRVREAQRAIQRRLARETGQGGPAGSASLGSPSFSFRYGDDSADRHTAPNATTSHNSGWETTREGTDEWRHRDDGDASSVPNTPSRYANAANAAAVEAAEDAVAAAVAAADAKLGIDGFLRVYTGEDNASFSAILENQNHKKRQKQLAIETANADAARRAAGNGELAFAREPAMNDMFFRDSKSNAIASFVASRSGQNQKLVTVSRNTRFEAPAENYGKVSSRNTPSAKPQRAPYSAVATPLLEPGLGASPLMTWGELASTPNRLDGTATPRVSASPFRVSGVDGRERTLRKLVKGIDGGKAVSGSGARDSRNRAGKQTPARLSRAAIALARRVHTPRRDEATNKADANAEDSSFEGSLRRAYSGRK